MSLYTYMPAVHALCDPWDCEQVMSGAHLALRKGANHEWI